LEEHIGEDVFDIVLCNDYYAGSLKEGQWVLADEKSRSDVRLYCADLVDRDYPWRHDSSKLAQVIMNLFYERTGPLGE
jgi:hypothetical protein